MNKIIKNKNILILTYLFESGLFYLGKSLYNELCKNNNVILFPKEKYYKTKSGRFHPIYPKRKSENLLDNLRHKDILKYNSNNILNFIKDMNIELVISLETFMPNSAWINNAKKLGVKVIDVPMPEWTNFSLIKSGRYNVFDEIWCLSKTSYALFSGYDNRVMIEWDYANDILQSFSKTKKQIGLFYHPASLNPSFSQKNTGLVIESFLEFEKEKNVKLIITGSLSEKQKKMAKKSNNIMIINEILEKKDIYKIYEKAQCLLAPSSREGLGLHFYEAKKMGCEIITTDVDPMNLHSPYLCQVISYNKGDSPVPFAETSKGEILKQLNRFYKERING